MKWILIYIWETTDFSLNWLKEAKFEVEGFCDLDYTTDLHKMRLITGYIFTYEGNTISLRLELELIISLFTIESE